MGFWKRATGGSGAGRGAIEALGPQQLLEGVHARVMGTAVLPRDAGSLYPYARPLAGDLAALLAFDSPTAVDLLRGADLDLVGVEVAWAAGMAHLAAVPLEEHSTQTVDGVEVHSVTGQSFFTASKLLVLDSVLHQLFGARDFPFGLLVSVPHRHHLAFHVISDSSVIPAVQLLAGFSEASFQEAAGALSPYLYWWRQGQMAQLSHASADGGRHIVPTPEFIDVLNQLVAAEHA